MIQFFREGNTVTARVQTNITDKKYWYKFSYECRSDDHAELLLRYFQRALNISVEDLVTKAYEAGYKDGRCHQAKGLNSPWPRLGRADNA